MTETEVVLSEDIANHFPISMGVRYHILRSHEEEFRSGFLGLRKQKLTVIDDLRLTGISVRSASGDTWEIPLGSLTPEQ